MAAANGYLLLQTGVVYLMQLKRSLWVTIGGVVIVRKRLEIVVVGQTKPCFRGLFHTLYLMCNSSSYNLLTV